MKFIIVFGGQAGHRILSRYLDRRYYDKRWIAEFLKQVAESGIKKGLFE